MHVQINFCIYHELLQEGRIWIKRFTLNLALTSNPGHDHVDRYRPFKMQVSRLYRQKRCTIASAAKYEYNSTALECSDVLIYMGFVMRWSNVYQIPSRRPEFSFLD